jgi:hypothetical protein
MRIVIPPSVKRKFNNKNKNNMSQNSPKKNYEQFLEWLKVFKTKKK